MSTGCRATTLLIIMHSRMTYEIVESQIMIGRIGHFKGNGAQIHNSPRLFLIGQKIILVFDGRKGALQQKGQK